MRRERPLTPPECALISGMFGAHVDTEPVRIRRWRWWPLQPRNVCMAPMGHIHFAQESTAYRDCFASAPLAAQAFFLHEVTHIWQSQTRGRWYLPLMRHPFCRYAYRFVPGRPFAAYGLEQQAQIVRHVHLLRGGAAIPGAASLAALEAILPFG